MANTEDILNKHKKRDFIDDNEQLHALFAGAGLMDVIDLRAA